jgi:hypothetical protein
MYVRVLQYICQIRSEVLWREFTSVRYREEDDFLKEMVFLTLTDLIMIYSGKTNHDESIIRIIH